MLEKPSNMIAKDDALRAIQAMPENLVSLEEIQQALEEDDQARTP